MEEILLIGGMPRSGTTLLSNFVQQRFAIPVCPETHFFLSGYASQTGISIDHLPLEVLQNELVGGAYRSMQGAKYKNAIDGFEAILARVFKEQFHFISEKTPAHLEYFYAIAAARDNYRFIVLDRSMSEVVDSLSRMKWNKRAYFRNCLTWVRHHYLSVKLKKHFPKRVQIVRYDLLCSNPDLVFRKLKNNLGLYRTSQNVEGFKNFDERHAPWKIGSGDAPWVNQKKLKLNPPSIVLMNIFELFVRLFVKKIV